VDLKTSQNSFEQSAKRPKISSLSNNSFSFESSKVDNSKYVVFSSTEKKSGPYIEMKKISAKLSAISAAPYVSKNVSTFKKVLRSSKGVLKCVFCQMKPYENGLGELFGPYMSFESRETQTTTLCWFHQDCALHTRSIFYKGEKLFGLNVELKVSSNLKCAICNKFGSTISCMKCSKNFHYPCASNENLKIRYSGQTCCHDCIK